MKNLYFIIIILGSCAAPTKEKLSIIVEKDKISINEKELILNCKKEIIRSILGYESNSKIQSPDEIKNSILRSGEIAPDYYVYDRDGLVFICQQYSDNLQLKVCYRKDKSNYYIHEHFFDPYNQFSGKLKIGSIEVDSLTTLNKLLNVSGIEVIWSKVDRIFLPNDTISYFTLLYGEYNIIYYELNKTILSIVIQKNIDTLINGWTTNDINNLRYKLTNSDFVKKYSYELDLDINELVDCGVKGICSLISHAEIETLSKDASHRIDSILNKCLKNLYSIYE